MCDHGGPGRKRGAKTPETSLGAYVRTRIGYSVVAGIMLGSLAPNGLLARHQTTEQSTSVVGAGRASDGDRALGRLPMRFERNLGQVGGPARFVLRSAGGTLFLADSEAVFSLPASKSPGPVASANDVVRMRPLHTQHDAVPVAGRRMQGVTNYLVGAEPSKWRKGVPSYDSVRYPGIYPGIDLVFHGGRQRLEYDYVVGAGANPDAIAVGFDTAGTVALDPSGDLVISGLHSSLRQPKPVAYQEVGGRRLEVSAKFVLLGRNEVGFHIGQYDHRRPLVIDPVVQFVSFLGGTGDNNGDRSDGLALDGTGNIFVTGTTTSLDFPVKGPQINTPDGSENVFVSKMTPDGSSLIYSTVFGGSWSELTGTEEGGGIAVDGSGAAVVVGSTQSADFPTTTNAYDRTCGTDADSFGNPDSACNGNVTYVGGATVAGSTTFRGNQTYFGDFDIGHAIYSPALPSGTTIVSVQSFDSITVSAPATATSNNVRYTVTDRRRWRDAFVSRLAPDGASLTYSTYLGGHSDEYYEVSVTVDTQGIYLAGATFSADFPTTDNAFDRTCGTVTPPETEGTCNTPASFSDGVTGADPNSPNDLLSTDARFNGEDVGKLVVGDNIAPNTAIVGIPQSNRAVLSQPPTAAGTGLSFTILDRKPMTLDGFVARIDPNASGAASLRYSTFLGGSADDQVNGLAAVPDNGGNVVLGGTTFSGDLPVPSTAFDRACGAEPTPGAPCDGRDGFVARIDTNASEQSSLRWISYLGGAGEDNGFTVATDATQSVFVTGRTEASGFPTKNAYQDTYHGNGDAFVTKMTADGTGLVFSTFLGGAGSDSGAAINVDKNGSVHLTGFGDTGFPQAGGIVQPSDAGPFAAKLAPSGSALVYSAILSAPSCCGGFGGVVADAAGNTLVSGSDGGDEDFPFFTGGFGAATRSGREVWLVKLVPGQMPVVTGLAPPGGPIPGGTSVAIKGEHLSGATKVTFGGVSASFTVDSDIQITAVSPPRPDGVALGDSVFVNVSTPAATSLNVTPSRYVYGIGLPTGACGSPCPLSGAMVALKTGKMLLTYGTNSKLYDPATGTWKATGSCAGCNGADSVVPDHGVTLLNDGRVLFTGGFGSGPTSSYLYDPATEVWSPTKNGSGTVTDMVVPRRGHTTTLLPNGKVLAAGGYDTNGDVIASSELFDPSTGTWAASGAMTQARRWHSAVVLDPAVGNCGSNCGKVLVAFGQYANTFQANNTAELYDPATGTWGQASTALGAGSLSGAAVQLKDGKVLLLGGSDSTGYGWHGRKSTDLFDPAGGPDGSWAAGSTLKSVRAQHPATVLLADGSVLVTGSADYFNFGAKPPVAELRNPSDGKWTPVAVLPSDNSAQAGLIPPGPLAACAIRCGTVLAVDSRSAQIWAPPPAITGLAPSSGPPGTDVTVTGMGLAAITAVRFGSVPASFTLDAALPDRKLVAVVPALAAGTVDVTLSGPGGASASGAATKFTVTAPPSNQQTTNTTAVTAPPGSGSGGQTAVQSQGITTPAALAGYRLVAADGGVFAFGLPFMGSTGGTRLNQPMAATANTPSGRGYWMAGRDGGVFAFGDAGYFGSTGGIRLASPVVGMARTPSGRGYWLVAADGGVFAFGDARFFGSTGGQRLARPVVALASTPTGNGYWLVAADGGVFAFGDARFHGSTGAMRLAQPVVGVSASPSGNGYRLVASDGGVFAFGDARFLGSTGGMQLARPVVAVTPTSSGNGYWLVASDGGVFAFGDAAFLGSTGALRLVQPVVAAAGG